MESFVNNTCYAYERAFIRLRLIADNGNFVTGGNQLYYKFTLAEHAYLEINQFHRLFLQPTAEMRAKKNLDKYRNTLVKMKSSQAVSGGFTFATLCIIGSIAVDCVDNRGCLKLEQLVSAMHDDSGLKEKAILRFNESVNATKDRVGSRNIKPFSAEARLLVYMVHGLQIVCDLIKEGYSLTTNSRYIDGEQIAELLNKLGLCNSLSYRMLYSVEHPQRALLLDIMNNHKSKHMLCKGACGEWLMVNTHEIKVLSHGESVVDVADIVDIAGNEARTDADNNEQDVQTKLVELPQTHQAVQIHSEVIRSTRRSRVIPPETPTIEKPGTTPKNFGKKPEGIKNISIDIGGI